MLASDSTSDSAWRPCPLLCTGPGPGPRCERARRCATPRSSTACSRPGRRSPAGGAARACRPSSVAPRPHRLSRTAASRLPATLALLTDWPASSTLRAVLPRRPAPARQRARDAAPALPHAPLQEGGGWACSRAVLAWWPGAATAHLAGTGGAATEGGREGLRLPRAQLRAGAQPLEKAPAATCCSAIQWGAGSRETSLASPAQHPLPGRRAPCGCPASRPRGAAPGEAVGEEGRDEAGDHAEDAEDDRQRGEAALRAPQPPVRMTAPRQRTAADQP